MDQSIFWDRKISEKAAGDILADPIHPKFIEIAALLLSRTNDLKMVFSEYLNKKTFVQQWFRIKSMMRKNSWSDERIDLWGQVYKTLSVKPEFKINIQKQKKTHKPSEFEGAGSILRTQRKKQGMTQQLLAQKARISQQTVSHAENSKGDLSLKTLKRILDVLELEFNIRPKTSSVSSFTFKD